jgi:hypothetical protein
MNRSFHVALAFLFFLGCIHSAYPGTDFDFDAPGGTASSGVCDPIYNDQDCPGIQSHFQMQPIPLGAIDGANGKMIAGYDVICEGSTVVSAGGAGTSTRDVLRSFGIIRVRYR